MKVKDSWVYCPARDATVGGEGGGDRATWGYFVFYFADRNKQREVGRGERDWGIRGELRNYVNYNTGEG